MSSKRGAIFDWDGVIINSARHHEISWDRLAAETGYVLPEGHFVQGFGRKNDFIIPEILGWTRDMEEVTKLSLRKEVLYREVVRDVGIETLPGVESWLKTLRDAKIPCVIGSSTHRENITTTLKVLGIEEFFADIVSAENVKVGKPNPEVFLTAASRIGVKPAGCVVFEDALVGIEAAKAAGMRTVAVATTEPKEKLAHADFVVDRMDELDVAKVWKK